MLRRCLATWLHHYSVKNVSWPDVVHVPCCCSSQNLIAVMTTGVLVAEISLSTQS